MQYRCEVMVIDKKLYSELQAQYCADPNSGTCPIYNVGDEYILRAMKEPTISGTL